MCFRDSDLGVELPLCVVLLDDGVDVAFEELLLLLIGGGDFVKTSEYVRRIGRTSATALGFLFELFDETTPDVVTFEPALFKRIPTLSIPKKKMQYKKGINTTKKIFFT